MVAAIAGAAVAFFQTTRIQSLVSRNYADLARARLAAEAATASGQALITTLFTNYPDSAVGWARVPDVPPPGIALPNNKYLGLTTFYFRTVNANGYQADGSNAATPASQPVFLFAYPLASGANAVPVSQFSSSQPVFTNTNTPGGLTGLNLTNSVDFNRDDWIGTPPGVPVADRPAMRGKWVEILLNPNAPKNMTNLDAAGMPSNPAIARYAFWAEDESFRLNVNRVGFADRGANTRGTNVSEMNLQPVLATNNPAFLLGIGSLQRDLRSNFPSVATLALADGAPTNEQNQNIAYPTNKFLLTTHSSALNFSRGGTLRLNLNQIISNVPPSANNYSDLVRTQLNRITAAITNNTSTNPNPAQRTAAMPNFGQRFYRTDESATGLNQLSVSGSSSGNAYTNLYLQRVAANIRDYIDTDFIPTVVTNANGFAVVATNNQGPWNARNGGSPFENELGALGKEPTPLLTEFAVALRYAAPVGNTFSFNLAFYFEFWNPTTNTITLNDLGNPTLTVANLYGFIIQGGGAISEATVNGQNRAVPPPVTRIDLPLSGFTGLTDFPPNSFTVLTTDTGGWPTSDFGYPSPSRLFANPAGVITYRGTLSPQSTRIQALVGSLASPARAGTGVTDYDTWMWLAGSQGYLESFSGLVTVTGGNNHALQIPDLSRATNIVRVSSLIGNNPATIVSRSGDPRSLNEPIQVFKFPGSASLERYSFANASPLSSESSLGFFTNTSRYSDPKNWADYVPDQTNNAANPAAISPYRHRNSLLDTIGRLGDVYDPARRAVNGALPLRATGGGRTFKIGQAERRDQTINPSGTWDGSETSASRNWTSWRLADVFTVNTPSPPWNTNTPPANPIDWDNNGSLNTNVVTRIGATNNLAFPSSEFDAASRLDGVLNINGALRDPNALKALVAGLVYESSPEGATTTATRSLNTNNFITAVRNHLSGGTLDTNPSNDRLFWERGQIGELADGQNRPLFSSPLNTLAGVALSTTQDRGREELVRRMMELITTKGNTFTVYAIGQSLNPRTGQPVATQRIKRTFRINPVFDPLLPADGSFNPALTGTGQAGDRFRRPTRFEISVLYNALE